MFGAEHYYGSLGCDSEHAWEQLQARYVLAMLFEYVATLGLIDVAYLPPQGARDDFRDRWGAGRQPTSSGLSWAAAHRQKLQKLPST